MRIDGYQRIAANALRAGARSSVGGGFSLPASVEAGRAAGPSAPVATTPMDMLLAAQMVDEPLHKRRKAVKRGSGMLDVLDGIKADLLVGPVGEGRMNQLLALLGQAREATEPGLDALVDEIELRVLVELAKHGRA